MFTGIVDHCGVITAITHSSNGIRLSISNHFTDLTLGESICVDGVCLTVTQFESNYFNCDLSPETLRLTLAKNYCVGDSVNLERSMRLSDRLGGHMVTGHADGIVRVKTVEMHNEFVCCEFFEIEKSHSLLLTPKGSVCINGVSLTINSADPDFFSVMLIPHTLQRTNLHQLKQNNYVNVEYDYLAKLVQRNLSHYNLGDKHAN